ncbi:transcriptional activator hypothetical protein [Limosa lapponica baueri]|uniref:Uncharacterized protein n=1 Tax=Limosa lapponica baueri TaxID=1758121 RepID=A0A2I0T9P2_LIMLA|nr:transcriptional activator hypothetical protein [Limosa lapponica baueri]
MYDHDYDGLLPKAGKRHLGKTRWTREEDEKLKKLVEQNGTEDWKVIANFLPVSGYWFLFPVLVTTLLSEVSQTDNAIKNHWNSTMRRKVEQEGYLQESSKACHSSAAPGFQKSNHLMAFSHNPPSAQLPVAGQPPLSSDYPYYHISEPQNRHYNDEDPEKEKRIKELELLLMSTENELKGQQALPDPSSWGDLSTFEFFEDTDTPASKAPSGKVAQLQQRGASACRPQGHPTTNLSKTMSSQGPPGSPKSLSASQGSAAPWVLLRQRRGHSSPLASGHGSALGLGDASSSTSPKRSPVKSLPFSPSQFLNTSSSHENLNLDNPSLTSTPVCGHKMAVTTPFHRDQAFKAQKENHVFRTPAIKRSILESSPRTPTPFKNALAAQEIKYGPLKMLPQTPTHLVEDLQDVIKQESEESAIVAGLHESGPPLLKKIKQEVESPTDKAGNFFCSNHWEGENLNTQLFTHASAMEDVPNLLTSSILKMPVSEEDGSFHKTFAVPRNRQLASPLQVTIL